MAQLEIREAAKADIREILKYIDEHNPAAALRFADRFGHVFELIASRPAMGVRRPDLPGEIRAFSLSPYILFYEIVEETVHVLRVLHAARDIPAQFE